MIETKNVTVSVNIRELEQFKKFADENGYSLSNLFYTSVREYIKANEKKSLVAECFSDLGNIFKMGILDKDNKNIDIALDNLEKKIASLK